MHALALDGFFGKTVDDFYTRRIITLLGQIIPG